ncbi:tRNA (N(6)-L-threonylcarbamoyladenosine(37)-C(2))-methylthiotransferase MtaB [Desulfovibrio psychrotolerans]|uniref:Radical SAM protein n=1 Tax=Desulfovibrio psychrotolerans TaxID=415242 RepID=A0A7J0BTY1_9BACT|nr:tRNA (N(6)-L-threonylcarbamoyladenosine(37)-C(2))-methylthiotransferase MtaB [Desulfovibrio psychrotolerans]GFM36622.1 radical SAM protein [Desulfovibrio psychrotolerans]
MREAFSFFMSTHGCKINQYETQALREEWLRRGFCEVNRAEDAGVVLVNSCAVTAKAVRELRAAVRKMHRDNPQARIVITGCAAQVMRKELASLPGVSLVVPQEEKASLKAWPGGAAAERAAAMEPVLPESADVGRLIEGSCAPSVTPATPSSFPDFAVTGYSRARAVVKVQDGCSHRCTYCIVPLTRGRSRSRDMAEIVAEARALLESGFREIILSGVNLRQYGRDLPETGNGQGRPDFWMLVRTLEHALGGEWAGRARLRLSSLEPGQLDRNALDTLAASRLVAPHLHISMQSGDDAVLKRMGRGHYAVDSLQTFLEELRGVWPLFGLGADILAGFPGETENEFARTLEAVRTMPLTYAHVFPYSRRPGTAAAAMPGQLERAVKTARARVLRELVAEKKAAFLQELVSAGVPQNVVLQASGTGDEGEREGEDADAARTQAGGVRGGISQMYTECLFTELPPGARARGMCAALPVAVRKGVLLVRPA